MAAGHVHGRRVDAADMAIRPAISQVDAAVPGMPEHLQRGLGDLAPRVALRRGDHLARRRERERVLGAVHGAAPVETCLSRRRCTEEGIRIASRYFATVRRAMSMPASRNFSTMVSSDSTSAAGSASIKCLMRCRTASAECASPPWEAAIAEVKKYLNSKMPRLVAIYLLAVTRDTVDSCMLMASATVLRLSGRRCSTPRAKNASCWRTISWATLRMVGARWSSARTSHVALCRHSVR